MSPRERLRALLRAPVFSSAWFLGWSIRVMAIYLLLEALGLRRYASVLSGTAVGGGGVWRMFLGLFFVFNYFLAVLLAPALLIASLVAWTAGSVWRKGQAGSTLPPRQPRA